MTPERVHGLKGKVTSGPYGTGTKSARTAIFLETLDGKHRYLLRRKSGPTYGDAVVDQMKGATVVCDGFLIGTMLLAEDIRVE